MTLLLAMMAVFQVKEIHCSGSSLIYDWNSVRVIYGGEWCTSKAWKVKRMHDIIDCSVGVRRKELPPMIGDCLRMWCDGDIIAIEPFVQNTYSPEQ